jgi:4-amino-4-deoxy-L-arabinose transferase-like glycosyltransferase
MASAGSIRLRAVARGGLDTWRLGWLGLAAGSLALYLAGAGGYDLIDGDEVRYAEAGRQMLVTGNWLLPQYNGEPRYQKPVLFYWLEALSQGLFGSNAWAARLPAALAGVGLVLLTASLGKALWGKRSGLCSGMALGLTGAMVLASRMVLTDGVLLFFIQGGLTCFCLAQRSESEREARNYTRLMYVSLAMGVLTKGPVALILPAAVIGAWLALRGEGRRVLPRLRLLEGAAIVALVAGPWYAAAHLRSGGEFTRHFFLYEYLTRYTTNVDTNPAGEPVLFYWLLLPALAFPWFGILPQAVRDGVRARLRSANFGEAAPWFCLLQVAVVMALFTFSRTKIWTYTLAVYPALALLLGRWMAQLKDEGGRMKDESPDPDRIHPSSFRLHPSRRRGATPFSGVLWPIAQVALALAIGATFLPSEYLPVELRAGGFPQAARVCLWTFAAVGGVLLAADRMASPGVALGLMGAGIGAGYLALYLALFPAIDRIWNEPVREVARALRDCPGAATVTYRLHELGLNYQARVSRVEEVRPRALPLLAQRLAGAQPLFVVTAPNHAGDLQGLRFYPWGRNARFVYGANVPPP